MMIETRIGGADSYGSKQGLESLLLSILQEYSAGLTDSELDQLLSPRGFNQQDRVDAINHLIGSKRLSLHVKADGQTLFKIVSEEHASRMRDLSYEEQLVYQVVADSGSLGALSFQFRGILGGQTQAKVNALLKAMEKKQLIKSLKSVSKGNKKVFMLADIEPSIEVTGGLTGTQSFELDLIESVQAKVEAFVRARGLVSQRELLVQMK